MSQDALTALRLRLPCPNCDELFSTTAFELAAHVALSCTRCGYGWVEVARLDAGLAQRAATFCAESGTAAPTAVPSVTTPDLAPALAGPGADS